MPDPRELVADLYIEFAAGLADEARRIIAPAFRRPLDIEQKLDGSPVTEIDRAVERRLRGLIAARHPGHGLIGEELGEDRPDAEWVWTLDPIDGTGAFISGLPTFTTLIALLHEGSPVLGLIDQPIAGERWIGAVFDGIPPAARYESTADTHSFHTSSTADIQTATAFATTPAMFTGDAEPAWERLSGAARRARYGIDGYAYGLLALGWIDIVCEAQLKPWDYLAVAPIVRAAGGRITDWNGDPLARGSGDRVLAAATEPLHRAALALIRGAGGTPDEALLPDMTGRSNEG